MSLGHLGENTQGPRQLSEYEIHDILRNERRARTIKHLKNADGTVTLRDLSEQLATIETGETPPPRNIRESVYNALHQTHLPKLDDMGVIEYEHNRKLITLADGSQQVDVYLEVVQADDVPWATYYWTVGTLMLVAIALSDAGVAVFAALPVTAWVGLCLCVLGLSAAYQFVEHKWLQLDHAS